MCVQTLLSSEEAFRFFKKNLRFPEEAFQFEVGAAPQTHFGKAFRMSASFFLMRTVRSTFGSCGLVCSFPDKELSEFHQYLKRAFDDPQKVKKGMVCVGKHCTVLYVCNICFSTFHLFL